MIEQALLVVQLALGLVFALSTAGKLRAPLAFARGVADYDLLPRALAFPAALMLIPAEAFLAAAHLTGWRLEWAVPMGLATLGGFALAVGLNLRRGRGLPCYCFDGRGGEPISSRTLARLALLLCAEASLLGGPLDAGRVYPDRLSAPADLAFALLWALAALWLGIWLLSLPDVIYVVKGCELCGRTDDTGGGARA